MIATECSIDFFQQGAKKGSIIMQAFSGSIFFIYPYNHFNLPFSERVQSLLFTSEQISKYTKYVGDRSARHCKEIVNKFTISLQCLTPVYWCLQ